MKHMKLTINRALVAASLFAISACSFSSKAQDPAKEPLKTIASIETQRYLGRWYEIAKYPNNFQKQCISDTTAQYSIKSNNNIQVLNRCRNKSGQMEDAIGEARQVGGAQSPKLQVRFAPSWLSVFPFVWGNYWVVDLDDQYQLSAVSEPKREFLWILSRTPTVDQTRYFALLARLQAQGLDTKKLVLTPQQNPAN